MIQENITLDQIEKICKTQLKEHLIDFYLFDVFKDPTWQNQKSYAIRLVLENKEKTFEDKEIDHLMLPLIQKLEKEIGATIRS
jgi:phenylalanyl-tRNA synthetase beta chain